MKRRILAVGLVLAAAAGAWYWHTYLRGPRWNVLIVTLDTTRADRMGVYGHAAAQTPAFDGLAQRGVLFERAYATAPMTLPSHATMFTGLQPLEHGLTTNGSGRLPEELTTLAELLAQRGCRTGAFVGAFVLDSKFGLDQGFETYNDDLSGTPRPVDVLHRERPGNVVVDAALKWLDEQRQERFHCWIHLYDPHLPYLPHPDNGADPFADAPYDGEIAFADRQLARVLDYLAQHQLDDRTLVVVVGDHGEGLDEHHEHGHGYQLYESTLRVPLVIVPPGDGPRGLRIPEPVSLVDLCPTLLDLLGLTSTDNVSGASLAGVWSGEPVAPRACFSMTNEPLLDNGWSPLRSLTTADWKYVRTPKPELYDLRADPGETTNLAEAQPDRVADLEAQLAALEAGLHPREAAVAKLTEAEKRALTSLGYTGALTGRSADATVQLPDVKDKLPLYNRLSEAVHLLEAGDLPGAEALLREIVAADPLWTKARGNLGICLAQQGRREEALECFQKVLDVDPNDRSALLNMAGTLAGLQRFDEAIQRYRQALAADPESPVPPTQLGLLYQQLGDLPQAEMLFGQAIERDPTYDPVMCAQGDLAIAQGDGDRAVERYAAAIAVNPRSVPALVNLGIIAAQQGQLDDAEMLFRKGVEAAPRDPLPRQNLARVATYRGRPEETAAGFEAILLDTPNDLSTVVALGWLRAASPVDAIRNADRALALADTAVRLTQRQSPDALDLLAAALAEAGRFDEALATIDEALQLTTTHPVSEQSLGLMQARRSLYAARRPYRSQPVAVAPQQPGP